MATRDVFVTGANGYLGLAIARALRARGHTVYGGIRSESNSQLLERHEIIPVVCTTLHEVPQRIQQLGVTAIVETHTMTPDAPEVTSALLGALPGDARYLYASGCLVYGDRPSEECFESDAVPESRRAEIEALVLKHAVCGTVLRPAFVFGGDGGIYATRYWRAGESGTVAIRGKPDKAWAWVHVDDAADAFALALGAPEESVRGQIFNLSDGTRTVFREIVSEMARVHSGAQDLSVEILPAETPADQAFDKSCYYKSEKAARVLGWVPSRPPLTKDLQVYHRSWLARL